MKIFNKFLRLLFPEKCISCGNEGEIICEKCALGVKLLMRQECPFCRRESRDGKLCVNYCSENYFFNNLLVCTRYSASSIIKTLIKKFKYKNKKGLYLFFGDIMLRQMKIFFNNNRSLSEIVLIPVPISKDKLRERGYNQSKLVAMFLAENMSFRYAEPLKWTNYQGQQAGRKFKDRVKSRAFTMDIYNNMEIEIKGKNIVLIDDIAASLSTANECARVLKKYGASQIIIFVISRSKKNLLR